MHLLAQIKIDGTNQNVAPLLQQTRPPNKVKVCYKAARYRSHSRAAQLNRELIQVDYELVEKLDAAEIVILHLEPRNFSYLYEKYPVLNKKYVIGYCVWEATELPRSYVDSIRYVQEIWTCSRYCCDIFGRYHPRVVYIPHVIERSTNYSPGDLAEVRRIVSYNPNYLYYLFITKQWDKRKNTRALVTSFLDLRAAMPNSRLIVKACPADVVEELPKDGIIYVREHFTNEQMNALYRAADVYVSAHHSEGWGLNLSDALIFQKPTVATGYSGNLEFMNEENSFLVDFTVNSIKPEDCFDLFQESMQWAYPSDSDLQRKLLFLYDNPNNPLVRTKIQNASRGIEAFRRSSVHQLIKNRLASILDSQLFSYMLSKS